MSGTGERIAKVIARAGICSRRDAERMIAEGRVTLDGQALDSPAVNVVPESRIEIDGRALPAPERPRLWRYHKPKGLVTTARDPQGRRTVFDALPPGLPRLLTVGRLDMDSEGLLLLTNDGALKRRMELPEMGWIRRYRVRAFGRADAGKLVGLRRGITVDGLRYGPVEAELERQGGANAWLVMALREGKNREIRHICEHLGLIVNRLIRVSYGPFQLGRLARGELSEVSAKVLDEQFGLRRDRGQGFAKAKARPTKPAGAKPQPSRRGGKAAKRPDQRAHRRRTA